MKRIIIAVLICLLPTTIFAWTTGTLTVKGNSTFEGNATFENIPILPASDPTTDNQAVRKAYVDRYANASNLASGTVPTARLGSGTANATTFLRGDQTFATVSIAPVNTIFNFVHLASPYWNKTGNSEQEIIVTKFRMAPGLTTLTFWCYGVITGTGASNYAYASISGGNKAMTGAFTTSYSWQSGTCDISGLTPGTTYDISIGLYPHDATLLSAYYLIGIVS